MTESRTPDSRAAVDSSDLRPQVRERYGAIAEDRAGGCCGGNCGCGAQGTMTELGYTQEQIAVVPAGADLGLGCGNPLAYAEVKAGDTVLDLGSGAGIDCFLAAREVGPDGHVIGVDMTPAMLERSRANAARLAHGNVEFRLGEIEHLPLADATVDVVISNCVVNLSPEKDQVFREALRVLKPGGRLAISDLVLTRELTPELRTNVDLYCGCVAGAALRDEYLALIRDAGFRDVEVMAEGRYAVAEDALPPSGPERDAFSAVVSLKVRARKA